MMRWVAWLLVLLAAVGWLATEVPLPNTSAALESEFDTWRRTPDGWQRAPWLAPEVPVRRPALHPVVVGLMELLVCLAALVAFPCRAKSIAAHNWGSSGSLHEPSFPLRRSTTAPRGAPSNRPGLSSP